MPVLRRVRIVDGKVVCYYHSACVCYVSHVDYGYLDGKDEKAEQVLTLAGDNTRFIPQWDGQLCLVNLGSSIAVLRWFV